jgi:hypothetical protein
MLTLLKARWFAFGLFALVYVLTAAASVTSNHQREPRCGTADCMLLLNMTRSQSNASSTAPLSKH